MLLPIVLVTHPYGAVLPLGVNPITIQRDLCRLLTGVNPEHQHRVWSERILEGMDAGEDDETIARHSVTSSAEMTVMGLKRYWQKVHPERLESSTQ